MAKVSTKSKLKLAAGWTAGVAVMVAAACVVGPASKPPAASPSGGNGTAVAHVSQQRLDDEPLAFVEVSAARFVTPDNPRGWAWPHGLTLERDGWSVLAPQAAKLRAAGYRVLALWEPAGQIEGLNDCMAWASEELIKANWSPVMRDSWPGFVKSLRALGMEPMWYLGCAGHHLDSIVADLAYISGEMHVRIIGLDAFSWVIHTDPGGAERGLSALRADERTKDLTLVTEGWLPVDLAGAKRAFYLRHLVQLELARGSAGTLASVDDNWARMASLPLDRRIVRGCVGVVLMHGANWKATDLEACYARAKQLGLVPCDYRIPMGAWK